MPFQAVRQSVPISIQVCTDDLKHSLQSVWRDVEGVDLQGSSHKLATYHALFAVPFESKVLIPLRVLLLVYQGTCFWICLSVYYGTLAVSGLGHTNSGWKQQLGILVTLLYVTVVIVIRYKMRCMLSLCVKMCALRHKCAHFFQSICW